MLPHLIDHHMHLMIVGRRCFADGITGAVDLGSLLDLVPRG